MTRAIEQKLARLSAGGQPRVIDLFAGCGGLSLGFRAAGFAVVAAVESDPHAAQTHGHNFHNGEPEHSRARDVSSPPEQLVDDLGLGSVDTAFDVVMGGPPCQAFARVGRPKLREIDDHPAAFIHDPRASLYLDWLFYVEACQPIAVLMENVPDVLNHGGHNIADETCAVLDAMGYTCAYSLLNAAYYGVPQMRERMFLLGYRKELVHPVAFPDPTHWVSLPAGYEGSRAVALRLLRETDTPQPTSRYSTPPEARDSLPPAITAIEALGDLPSIDARAQLRSGALRRGARRFDKPIAWDPCREVSAYARLMRTWPGFEAPEELFDHVIRYLPRDYELFARMNVGDQYPEAWRHARDMLAEKLRGLRKRQQVVQKKERQFLYREYVPPYDVNKFPNKWRKMWPDAPARTLMAHLGKDGYSHIHYDSDQARTISVREAARLQSFPDGFAFCGTMNPAFRQIGNAVPPLMAKALADEVMRAFRAAVSEAVHGYEQEAAPL